MYDISDIALYNISGSGVWSRGGNPGKCNFAEFLRVFGQNMSIENLNSMPAEVRQFFGDFCIYLTVKRCNLGLIFQSGASTLGSKGRPGPRGSLGFATGTNSE